MKKITVIVLMCVLVVGSFAGGLFLGAIGTKASGASEDNIAITADQYDLLMQYSKLEAVREIIHDEFYADYDESILNDYAIKGMIASLGDIYSNYYTAEEYEQRLADDEGNYVGIGVQLTLDKEDICTVTHVFEDSPALEAGMQPGDQIVGVNGNDVRGMVLDDIVSQVRGASGSTVDLIIWRGDETLEMTVGRADVVSNHVNYRMIDDEIGYIEITGFTGDDVTGFMQAISFIESKNAKALVLDLRYNGGGYVEDATRIADVLLPEGTVYTLEDKDGQITETASSDKKCLGMPLAILTNAFTASASEILAGAVQDYGVGVLVGTQSFGKGIVQSPFGFKDGSVLYMTTEYYLTPNGRKIHGEGLTPDIESEIDMTLNPYLLTDEEDTQLQDALTYLRKQLNH